MPIGSTSRQKKTVPRRLLIIAAILSVVAMTGGLVLYSYTLFLRFMWEQVSTTRQYYTLAHSKKAGIEFSIDRLNQLLAPSSRTLPVLKPVSLPIATALSSISPGTMAQLHLPQSRPFTLLVNHRLNAKQIEEVSQSMARVVEFDRLFWGLQSMLPGARTNLIFADGSVALIVPALEIPQASGGINVEKLFDFWTSMIALYQERAREMGDETVWSPAYADRFTKEQVMSYAAPVKDEQGKLIAVVDLTIHGAKLMGDVIDQDGEFITTGHQVAFFNNDGKVLYRGKNTQAFDFDGLGQRINQRLGGRSHGEIYWFEQGALMVSGLRSSQAWRSLYIYPLSQALFDYRWPLSIAVCLYLLGLFSVYRGVLVVRRRVLLPMQRDAERIEERERFNRTVLRIAPVGLRVVRLSDGQPEAENELAKRILPHDTLCDGYTWFARLSTDTPDRLLLQVGDADGMVRDIQIVSAPVSYQRHNVLLCVISDMTEEFCIRRSLQQAREAADRENRMKTMFVASMSHEIRTPLYGMIGTLELLTLTELSAGQRQQLDAIQRSSHVLLQELNDLLDYIKFDVGQMKLETQAFDPIELVETVVRAQSPIACRKQLQLICLLQPDLPWVNGDPVRTRQVFNNLLGNALKFTEQGEVIVRMGAENSDDPLRLRIEVADTGIGIAAEVQTQLFEPFYQGTSASGQRFEGSGLGLSICRQIVSRMRGEISVSSTPGQGSCFTATLELERGKPRAVSDDLPPVAVLCDHVEQQRNLIDIVAQVGGKAVAHGCDAPPPGTVLLIATAQSQNVPDGFAAVVRLLPDGPLVPEHRLDAWVVNAYSQDGLRRALRQAVGHDDSPLPTHAPALPWLGLHVLVAEDHPYTRQLIQSQLEQLGCRVHPVGNGEDALAAIRQENFDVLLTDVQMPMMDGHELTRRLRTGGSTLPVIGLTANIVQTEHERLLAAGMNSVLNKPIGVSELAAGLQAVLPKLIIRRQVERPQDAPAANLDGDTRARLLHSLREDAQQLFAAFERGDLSRTGQLAHRLHGAAVYAKGGEEIAALCDDIEQELDMVRDEIRAHVDDLALYLKAILDEKRGSV